MCPISSSEIAALNGGYQQQTMAQMQYASGIGQGNVYGGRMTSGVEGDQLVSKGMNRAAGIGVPLAAAGMSLMGLDPFSIGLKAGGAAAGSLGWAGGAAVGAGVALPLMAGMGAAKYAGSQMMEGASQQSALNQTLRGSFNFRNSSGGQGFDRQDMTQIGGMVRSMSEQFGPGGEITGFRELTSLAGKMGSMGFAQGVRDVKDFSNKFKEMVTTLKGMAKDLGTTLEGAMEFAAAAKGSGVFGMGNIAKFTGAAAAGTRGTGLALSEFTGAASIGSQISRSIGGLGKQGAAAGLRTMEQIGTAIKMGVLSEEDIYNATGQNGAEGRQAYAASQLQKSSEFLQTSKGRRFLASIAGKNGTLDEGGVQEVLSGGMDVEETRKRDNQMKTSVGRANFIRNEGRLRGAALERFGGNVAVMQMAEWAQGKGIDLNSTEGQDRGRLFMQRQLHMGRDDIDVAMKIVNAMPAIDRKMQQSHEDEAYFSKLAQDSKQRGIEGIENRFNQAKESVNNKLQQAGQRLFNSGSEALSRWMDKLAGTYEHVMTGRADDAIRAAGYGGASAKAELAAQLGVGGSNPFGSSPVQATKATVSGFTGVGAVEGFAAGFLGTSSLSSLPGMSAVSEILKGKSPQERFRDAGYDITANNDDELQSSLAGVRTKLSQKASAGTLTDKEKELMQGDLLRPGEGLSEGERQQVFGEAIMGSDSSMAGRLLGGAAGSLFGPVGIALGSAVGGAIHSSISGRDEKVSAAGRYATSEEGMKSAYALFGGAGSAVAKETEASMNDELAELKKNGNGQGTRAVELAEQLVAKAYASGGRDAISDDALKSIKEKYGSTGVDTTREGMRRVYGAVVGGAQSQQQKVREEESKRISTRAQKEMDKEKELGIDANVLGPSGLSKEADDAAKLHAKGLAARAGFVATGDPEKDKAAYAKIVSDAEAETSSLAGMSSAGRKELAKKYAGTAYGLQVSGVEAEEKRIEKGLKKGRVTETILGGVGLSLSAEQRKTMNMKDPESQKRLEQFMLENLSTGKGGEGEAHLKEEIQTLMKATKSGNVGEIFKATKAIEDDPEYKKKKKQDQENEEDKNPQLRLQKEGNEYLKLMAKKMIGASDLAAAIKADKDGEDGGKAPTGPGAGAVK